MSRVGHNRCEKKREGEDANTGKDRMGGMRFESSKYVSFYIRDGIHDTD